MYGRPVPLEGKKNTPRHASASPRTEANTPHCPRYMGSAIGCPVYFARAPRRGLLPLKNRNTYTPALLPDVQTSGCDVLHKS